MSLENRLHAVAHDRDLALLLAAGLVSQTGDWILSTGIAFEVYALTGSTIASAAVMLAMQIPQVVLGAVAGTVVDRLDRRRLMLICNAVAAIAVVPLALAHVSGLGAIIAVVAATSCLAPFFVSAEASLLPELVRRDDRLVTVNALNAQVRNVARLIGAALGGVLVSAGGLTTLAVADAASFAVAAALIAGIRHRSPGPARGAGAASSQASAAAPAAVRSFVADLREGLAAIARSRVLLVLAAFFALTGLGEGAMTTLFAPFVHGELRGSADVYGAILSVQAIGGILGGLAITLWGRRIAPRRLFAWGALAFGLIDLAMFLLPLLDRSAWPAAVLIAVVGLPGAAVDAGGLALFQTHSPAGARGRVFGSLVSLQNAAMLVSTLVAGGLAAAVGVIPVISTQGAVYVVVGVIAVVSLSARAVARSGRRAGGDADAAATPATAQPV